jgi:hypothetical protein
VGDALLFDGNEQEGEERSGILNKPLSKDIRERVWIVAALQSDDVARGAIAASCSVYNIPFAPSPGNRIIFFLCNQNNFSRAFIRAIKRQGRE